MSKYIAYYRVSTDRQGKSGLGLEAQREAVNQFLNGGQWELVAEYTEIESGKQNNRPRLQEALAHCRKAGAILIIAKLDRLGRNVHFISGLLESKVEFVACDNPHANRLMIHLLAAFAEHEREQISLRTRQALAAAKARGKKLGSPKIDDLAKKNQQDAQAYAESLRKTIDNLRADGPITGQAIAEALNEMKISTASGRGRWYQPTVHKLLQRLDSADKKKKTPSNP